jgi:hypothetical protein
MNKSWGRRAALAAVAAGLLATVPLPPHVYHPRAVASGREASHPRKDLDRFTGCWESGGYSLYIAVVDGKLTGLIRHGIIGMEDPQRVYNIKISSEEPNTIRGDWESDPMYKEKGGVEGRRQGTFALTRQGGRLNGKAMESPASGVEKFRGREWMWIWKRQGDSKLCKQHGTAP